MKMGIFGFNGRLWARRSCTSRRAGPAALLVVAIGLTSQAADSGYTILQPRAGGLSASPDITSVTLSNLQTILTWNGFAGPYQVEGLSSLGSGQWQPVGAPTALMSAVLTNSGAIQFLRINGKPPPFTGADTCLDCHSGTHSTWSQTAHARAFDTLKAIGKETDPSCVVCHSVGFGYPSGFIDEPTTPFFANVQCENCHGPAGNHVAWAQGSQQPPKVLPVTTKSAMLCGGCHNDFHHPTFDEWTSSPHSSVVEALVGDFSSTNRTTAIGRMNACGACHSGAVRLEMINAYTKNTGNAQTNVNWPTGFDATNTPTTCVVCHDTHGVHKYTNVLTGVAYTNQLRYPLSSTNFFSYNTGTNFASQYNTTVNVCGQCHNARGASVGSSGRPPHHSPQYNIMLGNIGITTNAVPPQGAHRNNSRQCAGCHTHQHGEANPTPDNPAYTGHAFRPHIEACAVCHTATTGPLSPTNLWFTVQSEISGRIGTTKNLLDLWATTKNTNSWAATYEKLGWEYTAPGQLSNPGASSSIKGPTAAEQAQIPQGIKDARFNLYLIEHDASKGIHNAPYARYLLDVADEKVNALLSAP